MIYDMKCLECGWEGERTCKAADRYDQGCAQPLSAPDPQRPEVTHCGGRLEVLISSTAETRFGFGFAPGLERADGTPVPGSGGKRRPITVQRGK
jgi:hypothetical protein